MISTFCCILSVAMVFYVPWAWLQWRKYQKIWRRLDQQEQALIGISPILETAQHLLGAPPDVFGIQGIQGLTGVQGILGYTALQGTTGIGDFRMGPPRKKQDWTPREDPGLWERTSNSIETSPERGVLEES